MGAKLIIRKVEDAIAKGIAVPTPGEISRNQLQIPTLLAAIEEFQFDCNIGGGRRDRKRPAPRNVSSARATRSASGT